MTLLRCFTRLPVSAGRWASFAIAAGGAGAVLMALRADDGALQEKKPPAAKADPVELLETFSSEFVEITPGRGKFPKSFSMGAIAGSPAERPAHEVAMS